MRSYWGNAGWTNAKNFRLTGGLQDGKRQVGVAIDRRVVSDIGPLNPHSGALFEDMVGGRSDAVEPDAVGWIPGGKSRQAQESQNGPVVLYPMENSS